MKELTFFKQEQHRHHDQRPVMMPAAPAPDWIVAQANILFALLQGAFHEIALALHERQPADWGVGWGVAEAVLDLGRGVDFPAHDQGLRPGLRFLSIP